MNPQGDALAERLDAALPQTQCTRCGYPDCRGYAEAMARGEADINRCPPGGMEGVQRLAAITGRAAQAIDPECGAEGPRTVAIVDETWCIGCTLCIKACPVDCIVGAPRQMHTVIEDQCTGCELCLPACPVDCIELVPVSGTATGWSAWSPAQADAALQRYRLRTARLTRDRTEHEDRQEARAQAKLDDLAAASRLSDPAALDRKRQLVEAALARARSRQASKPNT
jgi:electron transport complex protein RnfB